ncbi:ABC transporter ATP-binding protein [Paenibacillus sp. FSL W7-1287]|uniref:ABC transporter ATP-binding protein n=1 Tax=Paenibacillus sp. FSL W7-1287 TaxID=2954538 RepID=UPI0030F4C3B8
MIKVEQLSYHYGDRSVLDKFSYRFSSSNFYGIIGPNGAGKSTLLQLLAGVRAPLSGNVLLDDVPLRQIPRKQLARRIAVLQQGGLPALGFTVREVVEMGRFPYQGWLGGDLDNRKGIVEEALYLTGLTKLADRSLEQLSGGERQRVALAKVFVQQPDILLLDEPTTYLDIGYQQMIMEFVQQWQQNQQLLVIAVLHDLNAAALYCDELLALSNGRLLAAGSAVEVLTSPNVAELYDANTLIITHPEQAVPQLLLQPNKDNTNRYFAGDHKQNT